MVEQDYTKAGQAGLHILKEVIVGAYFILSGSESIFLKHNERMQLEL